MLISSKLTTPHCTTALVNNRLETMEDYRVKDWAMLGNLHVNNSFFETAKAAKSSLAAFKSCAIFSILPYKPLSLLVLSSTVPWKSADHVCSVSLY